MNYQSEENLAKKFKPAKGWEIIGIDDGSGKRLESVRAVKGRWMVEVEIQGSLYNDGQGYPYINLKMWNDREYKYVCSFDKIQRCIEYIKSYAASVKF